MLAVEYAREVDVTIHHSAQNVAFLGGLLEVGVRQLDRQPAFKLTLAP